MGFVRWVLINQEQSMRIGVLCLNLSLPSPDILKERHPDNQTQLMSLQGIKANVSSLISLLLSLYFFVSIPHHPLFFSVSISKCWRINRVSIPAIAILSVVMLLSKMWLAFCCGTIATINQALWFYLFLYVLCKIWSKKKKIYIINSIAFLATSVFSW